MFVLYQVLEVSKHQDELQFQVWTGSISISGLLMFSGCDARNEYNGNTSFNTGSTLSGMEGFISFFGRFW